MIKINVITNNINWLIIYKNPNNYFDKKIKKLKKKIKNLEKKKFFVLYYYQTIKK